jgi:quercetin dioxygenase-like cupin family protein
VNSRAARRLVTFGPGGVPAEKRLLWEAPAYAPDLLQLEVLPPDPATGVWAAVRYPAGYSMDLHEDPVFTEYLLVTEGTLVLTLEDGEVSLRAGDFVEIPPGLRHGWRAPDGTAEIAVLGVPTSPVV